MLQQQAKNKGKHLYDGHGHAYKVGTNIVVNLIPILPHANCIRLQ